MKKISIKNLRILAIATLSLLLLFLLLWLSCSADGATCMVAAILPTSLGGHIISGEPATVSTVQEYSPSLLQSEIDNRIVKIRPMSTPIDQISRLKGARKAGSMIVDYYSVDMKPTRVKLVEKYTEPTSNTVNSSHTRVKITVDNPDAIEVSDTLLAHSISGYDESGEYELDARLVLYVTSKDIETGELLVQAVNGKKIGSVKGCIPTIYEDTVFSRMGRAATELDVQTAQFESLPFKSQNFCQIFKMQIEQSTFLKMANKEVEWDFSDQEEVAIYDMRLSMEKSFLFGIKSSIYDPVKKENVNLTGGIWWQAGKDFYYNCSDDFTNDILIDLMRNAFTGNSGNKRKVLLAGSGLIARLSTLDVIRTMSNESSMVKWGLDFNEIVSKFGKLYVIHSEIFDDCGRVDDGIIIDPEYLQKWSHVPFGSQTLDLKKAGIRNTDALVLTEASCMTLRYPDAHMRIVGE